MRKKVIEIRTYSEFDNAHYYLERINVAGFHADLRCISPIPSGFGFNLGDYYEITIFQWTEDDE